MTEFIGSRISLISKRDIRYVGTLHEISSENSTVALERVVSYGTEGRRPDDEVPPALDNVYEYIVFRGSDVKDLRIEEGPKDNSAPQPSVPDDPAILGQSTRKPTPGQSQLQGAQAPPTQPPQPQQAPGGAVPGQPHQQGPPPGGFPQPNMPYGFNSNQRFGPPQGFPPGPYPFAPGPYGAPPGWYPPHGFPHMPPGQFPPHQMPIGGPGQRGAMPPQRGPNVPTPSGSAAPPEDQQQFSKPDEKLATAAKGPGGPAPPIPLQEAPSVPSPGIAKADGKADPTATVPVAQGKGAAGGMKGNRIVPAIPLPSPQPKGALPANGEAKEHTSKGTATGKSIEDANRDARAAVAAAMAKLPAVQGQKASGDEGLENLSKKFNEVRMSENVRTSRQPGTGGYAAGNRGGRGGHRGGARHQTQKVEIPKTDYDFESANAKFNKQDLVKEAIASGSPLGTPALDTSDAGFDTGSTADAITPANGTLRKGSDALSATPAAYNRSTSFFDDISSEIKDRAESHETGQRMGGREFRNEERQKNFETFGQGSVDNGYRYRGRGRGRGRGYGRGGRGRGGRGRGAASAGDGY